MKIYLNKAENFKKYMKMLNGLNDQTDFLLLE